MKKKIPPFLWRKKQPMEEDTATITGKPLKPHEYVVVRKVITAADAAEVRNHRMTYAGNNVVQPTEGTARLALVKRMIVRWQMTKTLTGPEGQKTEVQIELSPPAVENLPARVFDYIYDKINEMNKDEEGESDKDFLPAANGHSEENSSQANLTPLKGKK